MKLSSLFKRAVELAIAADPRGPSFTKTLLKKEADRQKKLTGREKELADLERTWNPYPDSRVVYGKENREITHLAVGIDMETQELLLVDHLRKNGKRIDAVLAHHPEGRGLADLHGAMSMQADLYALAGVPINQGEFLLHPRTVAVERHINARNNERAVRAAELLDLPLLCCHTITDNLAWKFIEQRVCKRSFDDLDALLNALLDIPEYMMYAKVGAPPLIINGNKSNRPGKIVATGFTGGTNSSEEFMEKQATAGVGTILCMHFTDKEVEVGKKHHINLVQCTHMASDSLGMNLLLDALKKQERKLTVLPLSGFVRVER